MEFVPLKEIDASDSTGPELFVKQESESDILNDFISESVPSVMAFDNPLTRIKDESESEEEIIENPRKKRRTYERSNKSGNKTAHRNGRIEKRKHRKHELTQLPCIVNIKSSAEFGTPSQRNHSETLDTSGEISNLSLQSSIPESESNDHIALNGDVEQNSSNNNFTSKVYEILVDMKSTLKDLKEEVAANSRKIDQLQNFIPQPQQWSWESARSDFNFPISTEEQLLEFEKQLENNEMATKLVVHLTSRTYASWREMILLCLKYMLSSNVAVLYNLNGIKGSKKKFRDLLICKILVESVQYKFQEATTEDILRRISLKLAGARDWHGSRKKKN